MKNKACCWILLIIGGGIVLCGFFIVLAIVSISSFTNFQSPSVSIDDNSYLVIRSSGAVSDYNTSPNLGIFGSSGGATVNDIRIALDRARTDDKIKAVILRPMGTRGFAGMREIREAVRNFKESGKTVYAYLDFGSDRDYYLASIADSIVLHPSHSTGLVFEGLGYSSTYVSRTLDKIGLQFHVIHAGDYKGAYENLGRDSMSAELRENIAILYESVFGIYTGEITSDRTRMSKAVFENEIMNGEHYIISGDEALQKGFVDLLMDWEELKLHLAPDEEEFPSVGVSRYLRSVKHHSDKIDEVAVVFAQGEISYSWNESDMWGDDDGIEAASTVELLSDLRDDDDVKAVVLRVNSPGGSAFASKLILDEIERLKEEKPVVVSMGNIAASGGYYISCAANEIVAEPSTITGSIGVVTLFPTAEKLYDMIGAREEIVKIGKWAEYFRVDKDLTAEQRGVLEYLIGNIYEEFKTDVSRGRGMSMEQVEAVAQGRVWTGTQALEAGLVDTLGGIELAISRASALANLSEDSYRISYYPHERDIFEFLASKFHLAVKSIAMNWSFDLETLRLQKAIEYLKTFYKSTDFVQVLLPVDLDQ